MLYSKDVYIFVNGRMIFDIDKCSIVVRTDSPQISLEVILNTGESELYVIEQIKPLGKTIKIDVLAPEQAREIPKETKVIDLANWKQQNY